MSELPGQGTIGDFLQEIDAPRPMEGYDAQGNLMDYVPELPQTSAEVSERLTVLETEIRTITEQVQRTTFIAALAIGKRLLEIKSLAPQGRWLEWVAKHLNYSERRAQDMMRLYEGYGRDTLPESVASLDYSKALALLSAPEEQRDQLAERTVAEGMSVRQLQEEIRQLREARQADQLRMEGLLSDVQRSEQTITEIKLERDQAREECLTAQRAIEGERQSVTLAQAKATAAETTAEALRKEKKAAADAAEMETKRALDAVQRANETQTRLAEAQRRIAELEARPAEVQTVEVVPESITAELEQLRARANQPARGEAEVRMRMAYKRLTEDFKEAEGLLADLVKEDAEVGNRYAAALAKACRMMADRLGEER